MIKYLSFQLLVIAVKQGAWVNFEDRGNFDEHFKGGLGGVGAPPGDGGLVLA